MPKKSAGAGLRFGHDCSMAGLGSHRLQWRDIPPTVRHSVEGLMGSTVLDAAGQSGGYGPGMAARCLLANGQRVFIKAVTPTVNTDAAEMMRREADIVASLPDEVPAPSLLHAFDDGAWVALVFEDVDGELPTTPWTVRELERVVAATMTIGALTPPAALPTVAHRFGQAFTGWRSLVAEGSSAVEDAWCREHLAELRDLESNWEDVTRGDQLIHGDLRSDNVLLTPDERVVFVDWTSSCVGTGWFDLVGMAASVELEGGGPPESLLALAGLDDLGAEVLAAAVAAVAGYFVERGRLPDPPGLPTVRAFQRAQGRVTVAWLQRLVDAS